MASTSYLLLSVLFSAVGLAYFSYGKKQAKATALISGAALMVFPYFVQGTLALVGIGAALSALPFLVEF